MGTGAVEATASRGGSGADLAMERYARGEAAAFAVVYDALAPRLQAMLLRRVRDREQVKDLLQKTFLQMHRARGAFVAGAAVFPWAYTIARRLLANELRDRRRTIDTTWDDAALVAAVAPDDGPDHHLAAREVAKRFGAALGAMPESQRQAFVLLKLDGLTIAEAAEVAGVTETALKLRAHRAYEALREVFSVGTETSERRRGSGEDGRAATDERRGRTP